MAKSNKWIVYTPVVELGYCWLHKPDDKFGDPTYKAEFFLSPEQAKKFAEMLENDPRAVLDKKKLKLKGNSVDGKVKFRAKQAASISFKDKNTGEVQTSEMKPKILMLKDGETIDYEGGYPKAGSTGEFELEVVPYSGFGGGLGLRLRGVRLHDVVEGASGESQAWGEAAFEGEEIVVTEHSTDGDDDDDSDRNW